MRVAINKEGNLYFLHAAPIDFKLLPVFDIPDELYERWQKNEAEASQIQDELKQIYESQRPGQNEKDESDGCSKTSLSQS